MITDPARRPSPILATLSRRLPQVPHPREDGRYGSDGRSGTPSFSGGIGAALLSLMWGGGLLDGVTINTVHKI